MAEALGTTKTGTFGVVDIFTDQRKYDKDKSKFFVWRERGHAPLVHVLITKLPKIQVSDPEPKHFEDGYRQVEFASIKASDSSAGALEDQVEFSNADAKQMQAGDLLKVEGNTTDSNWTSINSSSVISYGARSTTYTTEEVVKVVSKGVESAGTNGGTVVTVRRGMGATLPTTPPNLHLGCLFWHIGEAQEDGSGVRSSFSQNPVVVNNYVQIFGVPYEITNVAEKTDIFGENEWQRKARNARRDFARRLQRGFMSGRMYKELGSDNENIWYTGGLDEWIPADSTHRINFGKPLTQTNFNSAMKDVFLDGSEEKYGICGYGFLTKLSNAAADKIRYNEKLSNDIGLDVQSFSTAGGGTIHFLPDYEMSKTGKDEELYIADINYLGYMYMSGLDIHIDKGPKGTGLQANDEKKTIHQIYGVIGMKRQFKDAHFHIYGIS